MRESDQFLTEIELPVWQDPQGDVVMEKSRDYCQIYFDCWDEKKPPKQANYIAKLEFINAWAVRSVDIENYPVQPLGEYQFKSSIFVVENSSWLNDVFNLRNKYYSDNYTGWKDIEYKHFLVKGHDNYFEIIAQDYKVNKVKRRKAGKK